MRQVKVNINERAYKKLKNMKKRKNYPTYGDLIAHLIREQNKREDEQIKLEKFKQP